MAVLITRTLNLLLQSGLFSFSFATDCQVQVCLTLRAHPILLDVLVKPLVLVKVALLQRETRVDPLHQWTLIVIQSSLRVSLEFQAR
jgi:hypothetical protein